MRISKLSLVCFIGSLVSFGGAIYKFSTTGVTMSPIVFLGIGACLISLGIIAFFEHKERIKKRKN